MELVYDCLIYRLICFIVSREAARRFARNDQEPIDEGGEGWQKR
jgi:hypothetical protein